MISDVEFVALKEQEIEIAAQLIQKANKDMFPFLITKLEKPEQFYAETMLLLRFSFEVQQKLNKSQSTNIQYNHALKHDGKMIGIIVNIEIIQFYQSISHLTQSSQFYSMFKSIPIKQIKVGERVYQTRISILPEYMGKGYGRRILYQSIKYLQQRGYHSSYQGILIDASFKLYKGFGCQVLIEKQSQLTETYSITKRFATTNFQKGIKMYEQKEGKKIKQ